MVKQQHIPVNPTNQVFGIIANRVSTIPQPRRNAPFHGFDSKGDRMKNLVNTSIKARKLLIHEIKDKIHGSLDKIQLNNMVNKTHVVPVRRIMHKLEHSKSFKKKVNLLTQFSGASAKDVKHDINAIRSRITPKKLRKGHIHRVNKKPPVERKKRLHRNSDGPSEHNVPNFPDVTMDDVKGADDEDIRNNKAFTNELQSLAPSKKSEKQKVAPRVNPNVRKLERTIAAENKAEKAALVKSKRKHSKQFKNNREIENSHKRGHESQDNAAAKAEQQARVDSRNGVTSTQATTIQIDDTESENEEAKEVKPQPVKKIDTQALLKAMSRIRRDLKEQSKKEASTRAANYKKLMSDVEIGMEIAS